jgi:hypothetical protein
MDFKVIQRRLALLRDKIKKSGKISPEDERELKSILQNTLTTANNELQNMQEKLDSLMSIKAGNDNSNSNPPTPSPDDKGKKNTLSREQKKKIEQLEKAGNGSAQIH